MKSFFGLVVFLSAFSAFSQSGKDCENLVFNTRELNSFAYNTRCKTEAYPFLSRDGNKMYYTNNQTMDWLFFTQLDTLTQVWSVPVPLKIDNFSQFIRSSYMDEDKMELYFTSDGLYKCSSVEGSWTHFGQPVKIEIMGPGSDASEKEPFSALSFSPDMEEMYAYTGFTSISDGAPGDPKNTSNKSMGRYVKSGDNAYTLTGYPASSKEEMGVLCKGGLAYIFTNDEHVNLLFCRTRPSLKEDFGPEVYLLKAFESQLDVNQVRYADNSGELALVLSESLWEKNEIYFYHEKLPENWEAKLYSKEELRDAHLFTETVEKPCMIPIAEASKQLQTYQVIDKAGDDVVKLELGQPFPNPTDGRFFIYYSVKGANSVDKPILKLINNSGQIVHTQKLEDACGEASVQTTGLKPGVYYIRIDYNGFSSPSVKVTIGI